MKEKSKKSNKADPLITEDSRQLKKMMKVAEQIVLREDKKLLEELAKH